MDRRRFTSFKPLEGQLKAAFNVLSQGRTQLRYTGGFGVKLHSRIIDQNLQAGRQSADYLSSGRK